MKTNLLEVEKHLNQLKDDYAMKVKDFESYRKQYVTQTTELTRQKEIILNGFDVDRIKNAESILALKGLECGQFSERCVLEAIKDIANETNLMREKYFGVKNYSAWRHQECDCKYGYGPTHGYVVFSVGLRKPNEPLTDEQKEDCLYYLNLLKDKNARNKIVKPKENA